MLKHWRSYLLFAWPVACLIATAWAERSWHLASCNPYKPASDQFQNYCSGDYFEVIAILGDVRRWWIDLLVRPPEFITAISGLLLLFVTMWLAKIGARQQEIAARQVQIAHQQERLQRAYVFGGCGGTRLVRSSDGEIEKSPNGNPYFEFDPCHRNFGLTPAWVKELRWDICSDPPPDVPDYERKRTVIDDSASPGGMLKSSGPRITIEMTTPTLIYYGQHRYLDMVGNERFSGFIYRLNRDGSHTRLGDIYPAYVKFG